MKRNSFLLLSASLVIFNVYQVKAQDLKGFLDLAAMNKDYADTMESFYLTKAISLYPKNPMLYELRAYSRAKIKNPKDKNFGFTGAINDLAVAIKLDPVKVIFYEQRAYFLSLADRDYEAIDDLNIAIKIDKKNGNLYSKRADVWWKMTNIYRAFLDYSMAIRFNTENPYNYRKRGDCLLSSSDYYTAYSDYNRAIQLLTKDKPEAEKYNEEIVLSFLYRGNCKMHLSDYNGAISDMTSVIKHNEKFEGPIEYTFEALKFRGTSYVTLDELEKACIDFSKGVELGDSSAIDLKTKHCKDIKFETK